MKKTRAEKALPKNSPRKRVGSGRLVRPLGLWAVIIYTPQTEWINHWTIARTRTEARKLYFSLWTEAKHPKRHIRNGSAALVRVTLSLAGPNRRISAAPVELL